MVQEQQFRELAENTQTYLQSHQDRIEALESEVQLLRDMVQGLMEPKTIRKPRKVANG